MEIKSVPAGDIVENALSSVGITEDRVLQVVNAGRSLAGLPPTKDCGCKKRKQRISEALGSIPIPAALAPEEVKDAPRTNVWAGLVPPELPDGWSVVKDADGQECLSERAVLAQFLTGKMILWTIGGNSYSSCEAHSYCCKPLKPTAIAAWKMLNAG